VTRIGFTGHQRLTTATRRAVAAAVSDLLARSTEPLVGLTSLAEGSDQVFALSTLAAGGQLHVVIPCQGYEKTFATIDARDTYAALLSLATEAVTLPYPEPSEEAYLAAGHRIVDQCDTLIAVWDGLPAVGKGGTADIVQYAQQQRTHSRVIWPRGAERA
jgi:hypothetical protein